jgi:hypothetical protein
VDSATAVLPPEPAIRAGGLCPCGENASLLHDCEGPRRRVAICRGCGEWSCASECGRPCRIWAELLPPMPIRVSWDADGVPSWRHRDGTPWRLADGRTPKETP